MNKKNKQQVIEEPVKKKNFKSLDISNCKINEISIKDLVPNVIDNVLVNITDEKRVVVLNNDINGIKYKNWLKDKGGVFSKDVYNYTMNKNNSTYLLYENLNTNEQLVLRIIKEDEILDFDVKNLINGYIKDQPYMLFKKIYDNQITSYKFEKNISIEVEEEFLPNQTINQNNENEEVEYLNSISLFED